MKTSVTLILFAAACIVSGCSKPESFLNSPDDIIKKAIVEKLPIGTSKEQVLKYIHDEKLTIGSGLVIYDSAGQRMGKSNVGVALGFCDSGTIFCDCTVAAQFYFDSNDKLIFVHVYKARGCL